MEEMEILDDVLANEQIRAMTLQEVIDYTKSEDQGSEVPLTNMLQNESMFR